MVRCACSSSRFVGAVRQRKRKAPVTPSKSLKVGTVMLGANKKRWIVKEYKIRNKGVHRWTLI